MSALTASAGPAAVPVGVDLGGTGTRIAALDHDGVVLRHVTTPTATGIRPAQAIADLAHAITTATADLELQGIGIGATGPVDAQGVIRNPDTLPAFSDVEITSILSDRLGQPCVIDTPSRPRSASMLTGRAATALACWSSPWAPASASRRLAAGGRSAAPTAAIQKPGTLRSADHPRPAIADFPPAGSS
jgi:hypothetical protein